MSEDLPLSLNISLVKVWARLKSLDDYPAKIAANVETAHVWSLLQESLRVDVCLRNAYPYLMRPTQNTLPR
jgi:hypothetical protein